MANNTTFNVPESREERDALKKDLEILLNGHEEVAQNWFRELDKTEDRYRLFGMLYHTSSVQVRTSASLSPDIQDRLQGMYTDYSVWRESWIEGQEILLQMLRETSPNGAVETLLARKEALDSLRRRFLRFQVDSANMELQGWKQNVDQQTTNDLEALDLENANLIDSGIVGRWYIHDAVADQARGYHLPAVIGPEWEAYRQWVSTLPETRKSMSDIENPRSLDEIASSLLYKAGADQVDSHWYASLETSIPHPSFSRDDLNALSNTRGEASAGASAGWRSRGGLSRALGLNGIDDESVLPTRRPAPHRLGASHAVTPNTQVVEDGFV